MSCNTTGVAAGTPCAGDLPCIDGECDGEGACMAPNGVKEGWCQIDGECIEGGAALPSAPCEVCDADDNALEAKCDDGDPCTVDSCDAVSGACSSEALEDTGTLEICNGLDDDCDGLTDEGFEATHCSPDTPGEACTALTEARPGVPCQVCALGDEAIAGWGLEADGASCDAEKACHIGACSGGNCVESYDATNAHCSCCVSRHPASPGCGDAEIEEQVCAEADPLNPDDALHRCCTTHPNAHWHDECAEKAAELSYCGSIACDDALCNLAEAEDDSFCPGNEGFSDDCSLKVCGVDLDCDDDNPCTVDICNKIFYYADADDPGQILETQCTHVAAEVYNQTPGSCDDGDACNGALDQCVQGQCVPAGGEELECDDNVPCTSDFCDPEAGCVHEADDSACGDGFTCTIDACDVDKGCTHTPDAAACDDGNPCTDEVCDAETGCVTSPSAEAICSCCTIGGCNDPTIFEAVTEAYPECTTAWSGLCAAQANNVGGQEACGPTVCDDGLCNFDEALYGCGQSSGQASYPYDCMHSNPVQGDSQCINDDLYTCAYTYAVKLDPGLVVGQYMQDDICISLDPMIVTEVEANTPGCDASGAKACASDSECWTSESCIHHECLGGYCAYQWTCGQTGCFSDNDCPSGNDCSIAATCQTSGGPMGYCEYSYEPAGCSEPGGGSCTFTSECPTSSDTCLTPVCDDGYCAYTTLTTPGTPGCYPPTCNNTTDCTSIDPCVISYCDYQAVGGPVCKHEPALGSCDPGSEGPSCGGDSACESSDPCIDGVCDQGTCHFKVKSDGLNLCDPYCVTVSDCPSDDPCLIPSCMTNECTYTYNEGAASCGGSGGGDSTSCDESLDCPDSSDVCYEPGCEAGQCVAWYNTAKCSSEGETCFFEECQINDPCYEARCDDWGYCVADYVPFAAGCGPPQ